MDHVTLSTNGLDFHCLAWTIPTIGQAGVPPPGLRQVQSMPYRTDPCLTESLTRCSSTKQPLTLANSCMTWYLESEIDKKGHVILQP